VNSPRLWILLLALVSFLAGVAAGLVGSEYAGTEDVPERAFGDFERRFADEFDLDDVSRSFLAELLARYTLEIERIETRYTAEAHDQMEPELREAGEKLRIGVHDKLLVSDSQRSRFDHLLKNTLENL
jgi:hypothetical protein